MEHLEKTLVSAERMVQYEYECFLHKLKSPFDMMFGRNRVDQCARKEQAVWIESLGECWGWQSALFSDDCDEL